MRFSCPQPISEVRSALLMQALNLALANQCLHGPYPVHLNETDSSQPLLRWVEPHEHVPLSARLPNYRRHAWKEPAGDSSGPALWLWHRYMQNVPLSYRLDKTMLSGPGASHSAVPQMKQQSCPWV